MAHHVQFAFFSRSGNRVRDSDSALNAFPSFGYGVESGSYSSYRRTDPRIANYIRKALGSSRLVLNVGAGAGSYEPLDRVVVPVEPSKHMCGQRPGSLNRPIRAVADRLPFQDNIFDAAMAILTVHHWPDPASALKQVRRVTRGAVAILTFDPEAETEFWMFDYAPEMAVVEQQRYTRIRLITDALGGSNEIVRIPVPIDCSDRFQVALYARPEEFLIDEVRRSQSAWKFLPAGVEERVVASIRRDLKSGEWDRKYGHLRSRASINCQLRLVVSRPQTCES